MNNEKLNELEKQYYNAMTLNEHIEKINEIIEAAYNEYDDIVISYKINNENKKIKIALKNFTIKRIFQSNFKAIVEEIKKEYEKL